MSIDVHEWGSEPSALMVAESHPSAENALRMVASQRSVRDLEEGKE